MTEKKQSLVPTIMLSFGALVSCGAATWRARTGELESEGPAVRGHGCGRCTPWWTSTHQGYRVDLWPSSWPSRCSSRVNKEDQVTVSR